MPASHRGVHRRLARLEQTPCPRPGPGLAALLRWRGDTPFPTYTAADMLALRARGGMAACVADHLERQAQEAAR